MVQATQTGIRVPDKPISLHQVQGELNTADVDVDALGLTDGYVHAYDAEGVARDFTVAEQPIVDQVLADHVAMRDKTDAELSAEFQATTDPNRKQELRDQMSGLSPREQVPMT